MARAAAGWIRERRFHYSVTDSFDVDFIVETQKILNRPSRCIAIKAKAASQ